MPGQTMTRKVHPQLVSDLIMLEEPFLQWVEKLPTRSRAAFFQLVDMNQRWFNENGTVDLDEAPEYELASFNHWYNKLSRAFRKAGIPLFYWGHPALNS